MVVPKPNESIRICVHLIRLNESLPWERHIAPAVDNTLAKLQKTAVVFSKLDATSGFWPIPLNKDFQALTNFITLFRSPQYLNIYSLEFPRSFGKDQTEHDN